MKKWIQIDTEEISDFPSRGIITPSEVGTAVSGSGSGVSGVTCVTLVIRGALSDADIADLKQRLALGISAGATRGCDGIGFRGFGVDVCIGRGT